LVVHEPDHRAKSLVAERPRTQQSDLLLRCEDELDSGVRATLVEDARDCNEHDRDGRLVIRAQDRAARVAEHAVLEHGLERAVERHGVQVRAEEDRRPSRVRRLEAAVHVPCGRADFGARLVLRRLEPEPAQVSQHAIGHLPFLTRRAGHADQLVEERRDLGVIDPQHGAGS
jgi:hypothetical protein